MKEARRFNGKSERWRTSTQIFFLLIIVGSVVYAYLGHAHRYEVPKGNSSSEPLTVSLKLKSLVKQGTGGKPLMQELKLTSEDVEEGRRAFTNMRVEQNGDDENVKELWTTNPKYSTDNPLDYTFALHAQPIELKRMKHRDPQFVESYLDFALYNPEMASRVNLEWEDEIVLAPNVSDKDTVVNLALMSSNAYVRLPHTGDWRNVSEPWNSTDGVGHGWDSDGIRGHIFANEESNVVVIAIKGTSARGLPGSGEDETTANDKLNDNLLFSCCCARVSYLWTTVCDCFVKSYTCDETCLEHELRRKDRYFSGVLKVYKHVLKKYPDANVWVTGHSLGGALASLLGRTFGLPVVTFEAPPELLPSKRLHLPSPPGLPDYLEGVWHFGHTADPIFVGTCNGASSSCSIAGYAFETSCHSGRVCVYDAVNDLGWHVNMLNHRIHTVIDNVLNGYEDVAKCEKPAPCIDCYNWNFIRDRDSKPSKTITSTITSSTLSATTTPPETSSCVGRNWYGKCTMHG
ncbi:LAMI_0G11738g1_1 [Lachancea mirantina]|uniref:Putative lipase ATG15 n=1 Tax=Lachancea mirantina TaxID=1230905 RepID=A0A1G4KB40_9SACH|nr:LAMI_0G11738g1_1 [Lachancea mirantina]